MPTHHDNHTLPPYLPTYIPIKPASYPLSRLTLNNGIRSGELVPSSRTPNRTNRSSHRDRSDCGSRAAGRSSHPGRLSFPGIPSQAEEPVAWGCGCGEGWSERTLSRCKSTNQTVVTSIHAGAGKTEPDIFTLTNLVENYKLTVIILDRPQRYVSGLTFPLAILN